MSLVVSRLMYAIVIVHVKEIHGKNLELLMSLGGKHYSCIQVVKKTTLHLSDSCNRLYIPRGVYRGGGELVSYSEGNLRPTTVAVDMNV